MANYHLRTATIANGANESDVVDVRGLRPVQLLMPSAWTAANITFSGGAVSDTAYHGWLSAEDATLRTVIASASRSFDLPDWWDGINFLKIISGDVSGVKVNQGAQRVITLVCEVR